MHLVINYQNEIQVCYFKQTLKFKLINLIIIRNVLIYGILKIIDKGYLKDQVY